ncbi:hypothetical protein BD311DRAFT_810745 [Dichomitus squalens]|uniref:DUF6534 domain-containing protein n=1 Tax=Dichomitus squalens TaxID=114155 RepID=A0A4Q9PZM6_9APHY|nr:hypothetical protein BD311DRAFT_810745 [Dichomitus squalens]TBU59794.1 hypothetical protein BD310DRAFT_976328 [Dichomitus squalens]
MSDPANASTVNDGANPLLALAGSLPRAFGADLIGTFLGLILYGLAAHQLYRYCRLFPTDALFIRTLVALVMTFETVHVILTMHFCYYLLVTNYFKPTALSSGVWSLSALPIVISAIVLSSQLFFARRAYLTGPKFRPFVVVATLLIMGEIAFSVVTTVKAQVDTNLEDLHEKWLISVTLGMPLAADILFTITLLVVLRLSRTETQRNESPFDLFTLYIVNTGVLHCICNVAALVTNLVTIHGTSTTFLAFNIVAARLYANSLLSAQVLNSRDKKRGNITFDGSVGLNFIDRATRRAAAETWNVPQSPERPPSMINIKMTTELETDQESQWDQQTLEGLNTADSNKKMRRVLSV